MSFPAAGYLSNAARTEAEMKTALEDALKASKQIPGAGIADQALTIASGAITPASGSSNILVVDTEASSATDDLDLITQTNIDDGALVLVRNANAARVVVAKHNAGGTGQMSLKSGGNFVLADPSRHWLLLKRNGTSYLEVARYPSADLAPILSKSANYTTTAADRGQLIDCTANTFTLTLLAAATAGAGFEQTVRNSGVGLITIDPNGSELINGANTLLLYPGQSVSILCTGTAWITFSCGTNGHGVRTGHVQLLLDDTADPGFVMMNDGMIGSASSGATTRANADTELLYSLIWNKTVDQWAPVTGGRGANAAADFAANKAIKLPRALGRALAIYGTGGVVVSGVDGGVDIGTDMFTVPSNNATWITGMPVVFTLASGTITGLTSTNTYYIVRASTTTVQLASSLANAQNGTVINMTAKSSPVWTLTHTYMARALGEQVGEDAHAESSTEQLAHGHPNATPSTFAGGGGNNAPGSSIGSTGVVGGNAAMNIVQPTLFLNAQIKL